MSNTTLNTFAQQIVKEFAGTNAISDLDLVTQVERYTNDVIKHIRNYWDWPWMRTSESINTVASQAGYSLSSSAMEIVGMRIGGAYDVVIYPRLPETLSYEGVDLEATGRPELYVPTGYTVSTQVVTFNLWPVPDAIYPLIVYEAMRATDVASSSNIPLPEDFMAVLRDGMRHYMARDEGDLPGAQVALRMFDAGLQRLKKKYIPEDRDEFYNDVKTSSIRWPRLPSNY